MYSLSKRRLRPTDVAQIMSYGRCLAARLKIINANLPKNVSMSLSMDDISGLGVWRTWGCRVGWGGGC